MKTIKFILLVAVIVAGSSVITQAQRQSRQMSPEQLVRDLYRQHKQRSPFFQIRSRALLDKYFTRNLADLLWQDAHSSGDEVGALDGDPLFNAQDMEITNFAIKEPNLLPNGGTVPVTFENFGKKHVIMFSVARERGRWKIGDLLYDDGATLVQILRNENNRGQTIKIYLVAVGDDGKSGKKIGCGDSLVAITRPIQKTAAPLTAAIRELLITPEQSGGARRLENFWKGRNLKVTSVSIRNQTATIQLSGEVFVAGVCDVPRIQRQIEETARQFPTVKKVKVFIGKRTLAEAVR
ncbi:MAG TPA: GerMN domain-containing protein [Pyrinomonadaceae bacterium]|nr:GerMN domain-containing protein [Pyrinomonadaceae bacterium]